MLDFSWSEIVIIGVVALIVIGPKELPAVLRTVGHWTTKIRRMAGEFQSQFQEALREAEMADLKKEVDSAVDHFTDSARGVASSMTSHFDPLTEATKWEPKSANTIENKSAEPAVAPDNVYPPPHSAAQGSDVAAAAETAVETAPLETSAVETAPSELMPVEPVPIEAAGGIAPVAPQPPALTHPPDPTGAVRHDA